MFICEEYHDQKKVESITSDGHLFSAIMQKPMEKFYWDFVDH